MDVRPIRSEGEHRQALMEVDRLWGSKTGTPEGDHLDVLLALISSYEDTLAPRTQSDPIELLRFAIADMGRSEAELGALLGSPARASEVLSRTRPLTIEMIRSISAAWGLPADALIQPYELARRSA